MPIISTSAPVSPEAQKMSSISPKLKFLTPRANNLKNVNPAKVPKKTVASVPRYMTDTKRTKLEAVRDASIRKSKRERLYNIIVKKMVNTFGQ